MKKIILITILLIIFAKVVFADETDFDSIDWWIGQCGTGHGSTVNDIIFDCLGDRGYTGDINDRLQKWLQTATGLTTEADLTKLTKAYFVTGTRANSNGGDPNSILTEGGDSILMETGDSVLLE